MATLDLDVDSSSDSECSLNMGYSSSDFEDDATIDQGKSPESVGIHPYQFEPEYDGDDGQPHHEEDEVANDHRQERLGSTEWCSCENCHIMPTLTECVCCSKIPEMCHIKENTCITEHVGFSSVCLDQYVLQTAYMAFRQYHNANIPEGPARYRYTAYRQLARWCWGYLGKKVRVTLPACAVSLIRRTFPAEDNNYVGFNYALLT